MSNHSRLCDMLMSTGGPSVRYRTATELIADTSENEKRKLATKLVDSEEAQYWLNLLGTGPIHHSRDASYENCMGKLLELGLDVSISNQLHQKLTQYKGTFLSLGEHFDKRILASFMARARYQWKPLQQFVDEHIDRMTNSFRNTDFVFELFDSEKTGISPSHRSKGYFKPDFDPIMGKRHLPWCYDVYYLAYGEWKRTKDIDFIVENLLDPRTQGIKAHFVWLEERRYPFATGVARMPAFDGVFPPARRDQRLLVLYAEMMANFDVARRTPWFKSSLKHLESFSTEDGTYLFPSDYLTERKDSYYLYTGSHMGLGEKPRDKKAIKMESTFRMLRLQRECGQPLQ